MSESAIDIVDIHKSYGTFSAVRGLTLNVPRGSIFGFLGKNGAGKTTTIKMLMGVLRPDAGDARVLGFGIRSERDSIEIRKRAAFVSEIKEFYPYMSVSDIIRFTRGFYPAWRTDLEQKYLRLFDLPPAKKVTKLSKGMQSKLGLLLAFCRGAELLVLDEPTDGLDPEAIDQALQAIVSTAAEGATVFFSSHQLGEVEQVADHICIVDHGCKRLQDSLEDIKQNYRRVQLVFDDPVPVLAGQEIASSTREGRSISLLVNHGVEDVLERARSLNGRVVDVTPVTLKEIFLETVRGTSE